MMGFNVWDTIVDYLKFKGFLASTFREKAEWIIKYPLVLVMFSTFIAMILLDKIRR